MNQTRGMFKRRALAILPLALGMSLGGCAADVDDDDDGMVVDEADETSSALTSPEPETSADSDADCNDSDARDHKKHRKHKFKILDRLDGTKDRSIVIASLPEGLPEKLIAKLNKIDTDHDGIVTKAEAKVWWK